ncbi:MAG: hypothetical protein H8E28_08360 [Anaerolineae bacterium]|nr:hypothetical protein [Anaerolineae bacterium]
MSASLIWIVFPIVIAGILIALSRQRSLVFFGSIFVAALLALLAWQLKVDEVIIVGSGAFKIQPELSVAGRQFVISNADRPQIMFFYSMLVFWFVGTAAIRVPRLFIPLGLLSTTVFVAALSVEPPLFAALLNEIAVLITVFMLITVGERINRGLVRFLIYQTIGMLLILMAGWFLEGVQVDAGNIVDILRAAVLLGLGFALQLGIFPFHSWIPMLFEKTHPYITTFVLSLLLSVETIYIAGILSRNPWLQEILDIRAVLHFVGIMMLVVGGLWTAFQKNLSRILGFTFLAAIGQIVLMLSIEDGIQFFYAFSAPRILALGIWAVSLSLLRTHVLDMRFSSVQGMARRFPMIAGAVVVAQFSLAGMPLLAGFPTALILWEQYATSEYWPVLLSILGSASLMISGFRTLAVFVMGLDELKHEDDFNQWFVPRAILFIGVSFLFLMGLFPQWFVPALLSISTMTAPLVP